MSKKNNGRVVRSLGAGLILGFALFSPLVAPIGAAFLLIIAAALFLTATETPTATTPESDE